MSGTILEIPACGARAFPVKAGQTLRIIDPHGGQAGDLLLFNAHQLNERFSQGRTRVEARRCHVTAGDALWANVPAPHPMMTILRDTAGGHGLLYLPCCRWVLEKRFGVSREGCFELLVQALAPWGVPAHDLPDPLNLFFHTQISAGGGFSIGPKPRSAGQFLELRAEIDCLAAISSCPAPQPDRAPTPLRAEIT